MNQNVIALVFTTTFISTATIQAAPISWSAPADITGDSDVSTVGALVGAVNFAGPSATVNGVDFQALPISSGPASVGNFSVDGFFFNQYGAGGTGSNAAPFSNLSAGYQSLLGSAAVGAGTMTLTMSGLTIGQDYTFQAWVNNSPSETQPGFSFPVTVADDEMNAFDLDPNPSLAEGGLGQFIIGSFHADASSQVVTFSDDEVAVVNGFQLRANEATAVPEPGTALFGFALLGATGFVRRRALR